MPDPRLVIVTGKGGVGKTTVAAALARAAATEGKSALVVELATPGRLAGVLGMGRLATEPRPASPGIQAVHLDGASALEAFVDSLLPLRALSRRILSSETFRIVAAAVPGIMEVAILARIAQWLEVDTRTGRSAYDVVVLDAPASGHTVPLLSSPRTLSALAQVGPLGDVLQNVTDLLSDPERTTGVVVAIPEDWAVAEAVELYESLRGPLQVPVARPVMNAVFPKRFSARDEKALAYAEREGSVDPRLLASSSYFVRRRRSAARQLKRLKSGTGLRPIELPYLFSANMNLPELDEVAEAARPAIRPAGPDAHLMEGTGDF